MPLGKFKAELAAGDRFVARFDSFRQRNHIELAHDPNERPDHVLPFFRSLGQRVQ